MDSSETTALVPVREEAIDFYGDQLVAAQADDETIYVPLRPICNYLGLAWPGQYERLKGNPVLNESLRLVRISRTTATGGVPDMLCLPLKFLPGWLFGVQASRVKEELRERIIRYQRECYDILWNAFRVEIVAEPQRLPALGGAELALEIAEAIASLARHQLDMEQRLGDVAGRQEAMADYVKGFIRQTNDRLTSLELQLSGGATISEAQAAEIALAVKNVGQKLVAQGDKNGYAKVYSEMYRRYRVSSYKNLPAPRYEEVLGWLSGWYESLVTSEGR